MRILFFVDNLERGGLSSVILDITRALQTRGQRVGLGVLENVVERDFPEEVWSSVNDEVRPPRLERGAFRRRVTAFIERTIAAFEAEGGAADLVVAAGEMAIRCAPAVRHERMVISSHSSQLQAAKHPGWLGRTRLAIKRIRRGARLRRLLDGSHVHVVSEGLAAELTGELGVRPRSLNVIYNPFDVGGIRARALEPTPESDAQHAPFVVGVGLLIRRKRFDRLIDAFAASGVDGHLVLIGHGREEAALRARAEGAGLGDRFRIVPFHHNHYALVRKARLLVMSSDSEGFGNVLVEALILGVPALSTDCPHGPRDILEPVDPRALVPLDRTDLLATRLRELVDDPYAIPEPVVERFAVDRIAHEYLALARVFACRSE